MRGHQTRSILCLWLILNSLTGFSQTRIFQDAFSRVSDFTIISKSNPRYKEYYEITIRQAADHSDPSVKFNQRVYVEFQDLSAPVIMVTDGYAIDYISKPNELALELGANMVVVEHRFFGKSVPDSMDWKLLTMEQAAGDYHFIKSVLDNVLTGKWLATGISKGGQAALAYKIYYPQDVVATVVYGTAIKNKQTVFTDTLLSNLSQSTCGKKVNALQNYLFRNKRALLPQFADFTSRENIGFTLLDQETVLDYMLLELPFSFWQNGNNCEVIPDTATTSDKDLMKYLLKIVPPRFFTYKKQLEPAFYMFYRELGYYEYNTTPFLKYLKQEDYSNKSFAPQGISIQFDNSFHKKVRSLIESSASENVFFIYGQNDPWALQTTAVKNVFTVPAGNHKSRIADFTPQEQEDIYGKVKAFLK